MVKDRVFVSHPFKNNPEYNLERVDKICKALSAKEDIICISPLHLFSYMEDDSKREDILRTCFRLIDMCQRTYQFDYTGQSSGCLEEKKYTFSCGKPFYICEFHSDGTIIKNRL